MKHIKHVRYILPADRYINQLPNYSMFRRRTTLRMNPDHILDLHWKLADTYHSTSIGYTELLTTVSIHYVTMETLSHAKNNKCGEWCGTVLNTKTLTSQRNETLLFVPLFPSLKYKTYVKQFPL